MPAPPDDRSSLWAFAVRTYAIPGVAPLCLRLQDEHGLDVDVLLAMLWQASRGVRLDDAALARMLTAAARTQARVLEIRALRRAVGSDREHDPRWQPTYDALKTAELTAERVELACLEHACAPPSPPPCGPQGGPPPDPSMLAHDALHRYAARQGAASCGSLLLELVALALPQLPPDRA